MSVNIKMLRLLVYIKQFFLDHLKKLTANTLGWLAAIVLHCATLPSLLAIMAGLNDKLPSIDVILFIWAGLVLLFARAILLKDQLNIITIGIGLLLNPF